jgi:hypothetical protein
MTGPAGKLLFDPSTHLLTETFGDETINEMAAA